MEGWGPELAVILGIVEGLTEFLPVSSTGHLILVSHYLGFTGEGAVSIEISIQLGSILAVVAYERAKLLAFVSEALQEQAALRTLLRADRTTGRQPSWTQRRTVLTRSIESHRSLWFLVGLLVAFGPAAVVGLLFHGWIETYLFTPHTVAGALIIGGLVILAVEARPRRPRIEQLKHIGLWTALSVGFAQCLSLIPGVSRSGATIVGGMLVGMDRKIATEFSFFLALPTLFAATIYKLVQARAVLTADDLLALALGLVVAFLVAWAVIATLLAFLKHHTLRLFGYYRILVGLVVLLVLR